MSLVVCEYKGEMTEIVRLMKKIHMWVGPVVHTSILKFYMRCFFLRHQVADWV